MVHAPQTLAELQQQVCQLHAQATPWLPAGLGSRLDWGPAVAPGSMVLSGRNLAGIREHSADDFTVTVAAGTPLVVLQDALSHHGQWLSVDPPWGSADTSIGGLIARGLSGGYRQRHMGLRDQLLGIQLLRSDGVLARAGGRVVKNVAGYDLMRLLTGSWGSLALITEVTLRTQPIPPQRRTLVIQGPLAALEPLGRWLLNSSLSPERIDLWSAPLAQAGGLGEQPLLLLGLASIDATTLDEQLACIAAKVQELAPTPGPALEFSTPDPEAAAALLVSGRGAGPASNDSSAADWLLRLAVPPSQLWTLLASSELHGLPLTVASGSGIGDGWASATALPRYRVEALRRRCQQLGGYLTVLRQPEPAAGSAPLPAWLDAPSRPLIEALKRQFDPKQQLARGRLPGVASPLG